MRSRHGLHWRARLEQVRRQAREAASSPEQREQLLRRRADLLAQAANAAEPSAEEAIMIFTAAGERYGIPLTEVTEVITDARLAPVPGAPPEVAGVVQVRGDIRPVFDLARMLGRSSAAGGDGDTLVLIRHGGRERGIRVENVEDIRSVALEERRPAPAGSAHAAWVTADLVMVLNMDSLWEGDV